MDKLPFDLNLSLETKSSYRLKSISPVEKDFIIAESRLQLEAAHYMDWMEFNGRADLGYDYKINDVIAEIRDLNVDIYPQYWWNVKLGRQILTWGKGDLLFVNDFFPKDYQSFFSGRDIQYLKLPSDAIKVSLSPSFVQVNIVYTPRFDHDRFPTGDRIIFIDEMFNIVRHAELTMPTTIPEAYFNDDEVAWRIQRDFRKIDVSIYGYYGFWKSPAGFDFDESTYIFPVLQAHGFSVETQILKGILAIEGGYYYSSDDEKGTDAFVRNSELRSLIAYSRDFKNDFSMGLQYYNEHMMDHNAYKASFPGPNPLPQNQHLLTFRMRKLSLRQRLNMGIFIFYSLTNKDYYLLPRISYQLNDYWKIDIGGNIFEGDNIGNYWGLFKYNTNAYVGLKWAL